MKALIVCQAGMSTTIMCKKIKEAAEKDNENLDMKAVGLDSVAQGSEGRDIVILAPQIKYAAQNIRKQVNSEIPIMIINSQDFGLMCGDEVYRKMKAVIKQKKGEL